MPAAPLFHVGYHKTATTWMQRHLFTPDHGYRQLCGHEEVFNHIVRPHGLRFDPTPMQALISLASQTETAGEARIISSEILSGHPFLGGRESEVYAERLARIQPDAKILISIRNQMQILPSVYMQYVLRGGTMPAKHFFEGTDEVGYFGFTPEHFEYDRLVELYQRLFGPQNVYILPQETLRGGMMVDALVRLAQFSGNTRYSGLTEQAQKPVGQSYAEYTAPILRRINHIQKSTLNPWPILSLGQTPMGLYKLAGYVMKKPPIATFLKGHKPVSDHVKQRFHGYFSQSNLRLAALSAHPLDLSGYDGIKQAAHAGELLA